MTRLALAGRVAFGGWMLANGLIHFLGIHPMPAGATPLAAQLMRALINSELIDVVMAIELVGGALILAGLFVPVALCVLMPVSICAAYWAVVLNQQPLGALLALAAVALNALLMLAHIHDYRDMLQWRALAIPETADSSFEARYVDAGGRTSRGDFLPALAILLAAAAFYHFLVPSLLVRWILPVLLVPALVLHARRLRDMGQKAWWLLAPAALILAAVWIGAADPDHALLAPVGWAAAAVAVGFMLWGAIGNRQAGADRAGGPAGD
jgi:uncharacterized membrane protein YhaH (DUF805 family)